MHLSKCFPSAISWIQVTGSILFDIGSMLICFFWGFFLYRGLVPLESSHPKSAAGFINFGTGFFCPSRVSFLEFQNSKNLYPWGFFRTEQILFKFFHHSSKRNEPVGQETERHPTKTFPWAGDSNSVSEGWSSSWYKCSRSRFPSSHT